MSEEEIKEYLKRVDELELKLVDEDKDTLQWLIFGYNECAKLLYEKEQENQQLKEWLKEVINEIKTNDIYDRTEYECTQIATLESVLAKLQEIEGEMNE